MSLLAGWLHESPSGSPALAVIYDCFTFFNEVDVVYNAGYATIPTPVQVACAQIIKNAQATPALNVKSGKLDRMRLEYFSDKLVDETVTSLLEPYVSRKGS